MTHDYLELMWEESADMSAFLADLPDAEWEQPSLCAGWNVKAVMSHMLLGHTTPMPKMLATVARYGFNISKASADMSSRYAAEHGPAELRVGWDEVVSQRVRKGIAKVIPAKEGFFDHFVHHQDMRRPTGRLRAIPEARLLAALGVMPTIGGFVGSKQRAKGLRWRATDVDWTWGEGPEVSGTGEALILAATGRGATLGELAGDGVDVLRSRI